MRAVVFDVGRVLVNFDFTPFVNFLIARGAQISSTRDFFDKTDLLRFECGQIPAKKFLDNVEKLIGHRAPRSLILHTWQNVFNGVPEMLDLISAVKERREVYLLSNTNELHWSFLTETFALHDRVHGMCTSFGARAMKPNKQIYETCQKMFKLEPEKTLFIDDLLENVEAARSCGWHGLHHIDHASTSKHLRELGIL